MTTPPGTLDATVALRKPDGGRFDQADVDALMPRTLLVIEIDARAEDVEPVASDGQPAAVITLGRVIGWVPPASAAFGRTMLTGACQAVNTAVAQIGNGAGQ